MNKDKPSTLTDKSSSCNAIDHRQTSGLSFNATAKPGQLSLDDKIQFNCHKDIACFNRCCRQVEIQLTPYDILRLKKRLAISSKDFVATYTFPFEMDAHGMPGLRLTHKSGSSACIFLGEDGCSVYDDRPTACRYYPMGSLYVRRKENNHFKNVYFILKETHCLGHDEPKMLTVREYLHAQGAAHYDLYNEDWRDIIFRKRSIGPAIGRPSERSIQLFDMCSYDIDSFRDFIQGSGFLGLFDIDEQTLKILVDNEEELLLFAMRFLKQVLFGDKTISLRQGNHHTYMQERNNIQTPWREPEITALEKAEALE